MDSKVATKTLTCPMTGDGPVPESNSEGLLRRIVVRDKFYGAFSRLCDSVSVREEV